MLFYHHLFEQLHVVGEGFEEGQEVYTAKKSRSITETNSPY